MLNFRRDTEKNAYQTHFVNHVFFTLSGIFSWIHQNTLSNGSLENRVSIPFFNRFSKNSAIFNIVPRIPIRTSCNFWRIFTKDLNKFAHGAFIWELPPIFLYKLSRKVRKCCLCLIPRVWNETSFRSFSSSPDAMNKIFVHNWFLSSTWNIWKESIHFKTSS